MDGCCSVHAVIAQRNTTSLHLNTAKMFFNVFDDVFCSPSNLPFDMSPSDEFTAPVWNTNLIHTAPYVYNMQAVWRTGLRDFIIDGLDG